MERVIGERGIEERVVRRGQPGADEERRDADNRLPWLESADDDLDEAGGGVGRFFRILAAVLVIGALVAAGAWYYDREQRAMRADGSLIRAEHGPYKTRPEQPGGKTFAGTGDSAYAVSEGESREAALADAGAGAPSDDGLQAGAAAGAAVQLGAYVDQAGAETGWATLVQRNPVLSGISHRVTQARADTGPVYRLQAVSPDPAAANELCRTLKEAGTDCYVKE